MSDTPSIPLPSKLVVDLHDLPPEGREISGQLDCRIFELEEGAPQVASPLRYRLHILKDGDDAILSGEISADFVFECVLCLESFTDRIILPEYGTEVAAEGKTPTVDLTDALREDILLALPGHPHCGNGTLHPRTCPAAGVFPASTDYSEEHPEEQHPSGGPSDVWGTLDQLHLDSSAPSSLSAPQSRPKPTT